MSPRLPLVRRAAAAALALAMLPLLAAAADDGPAAQTPPAPPPAAPPGGMPPAGPPGPPGSPRPAAPGEPRPFDEVIKDTERLEGLFTLYRSKKGDLWLEVTPGLLGKTFLLQATATTGLGGMSGGITTGDPLWDAAFTLKRVRDQVHLTLLQLGFRAKEDEPVARSLRRSFQDSVLAAWDVASQPHPERNSFLVNITSFFYSDAPMLLPALQTGLRTPFMPDRAKSYLEKVLTYPENVEIEAAYHFTAPRPAASNTLADGRAVQVRVRYSFLELRENGYRPRCADPRVGYFVNAYRDLTEEDPGEDFVRCILRWNLEKQEPAAELSPPKKPIVFWLDNAIPLKYRPAIADGILLWNRAFERIGIKDAIVVKQIPDGEEFDAFDIRHNVLRWATSPGDAYAIALFRANPLTGEILKADIRLDASMVGFEQRYFRWEDELKGFTGVAPVPSPASALACEYGKLAVEDAAFGMAALDLMAAPGGLPTSERERYVREFLVEVVAHEMGHVLGLRHNFKASTLLSPAELNDREKTSRLGLTGSVMDYNPANLAPPGVKQGDFFATTLGPYDFWAIEYGYRRWPGLETAEAEKPRLAQIAARSGEPGHAYATDEDTVNLGYAPFATDPLSSRFDLSSDPLAYARQRARMVRELYGRLEARTPRHGESYADTRRKFQMLLGQYLSSFRVAGKYIGGLYFTRSHRGDIRAPGAPFAVVPVEKQREALAFVKGGLFDANAFQFPPSLLNRLGVEKNIHWGVPSPFETEMAYSVTDRVQQWQRTMLVWLFTPGLLSRLRDNEARVRRPSDTLTMAELFSAITAAVYSELRSPALATIPVLRRELQRSYLDLLITHYLGAQGAPADAQSLARFHLRGTAAQIRTVLARPAKLDEATRAHLEQTLERIQRVLKTQNITAD